MRDRLAGLRRKLQDRLRQPKTILPAPESAPTPPSPDNDDDSFLAPPSPAPTRPTRPRPTPADEGFLAPPETPRTPPPPLPAIDDDDDDSFLAPPTGGSTPLTGDHAPLPAVDWEFAELATEHGVCGQLELRGGAIAGDSARLLAAWQAAPRGRRDLHRLLAAPAEGLLLLDIETCGLNGQPVFLVGLGWLEPPDLRLEFLLARHPGEEAAMLAATAERLAAASALVTFNGTTFDLPYLQARGRHQRLPQLPAPPHHDLLLAARRHAGRRFGDCRLQTLERELTRRPRPIADLPSAQVPEVYRRWLLDGRPEGLHQVVIHCAHDLITMVGLVPALAELR